MNHRDHLSGSGCAPEAKAKKARPDPGATQFGKENLSDGLRPKTPAKVKAARDEATGKPRQRSTNGHQIGEEHLWMDGLMVSPTRTHNMMARHQPR